MRKSILDEAALFDIPGQAVIATDAEGQILFWNDAAEVLYGWQAEEVVGRNIVEVTPTDLSRKDAGAIMERLRAGQTWSGDFLVQHKHGAAFRVVVRDKPVRDATGELVGIIGISSRVVQTEASAGTRPSGNLRRRDRVGGG